MGSFSQNIKILLEENPPLTPREELHYAKKKNNCRKSFNILVKRNYRLVAAIIRAKENKYPINIDEVFSAGVEGLIISIEKFDPEKGYKLSTWASWWINQQIQVYVAKTDEGKQLLTPHQGNLLRSLWRQRSRLEQSLGRPLTEEELVIYFKDNTGLFADGHLPYLSLNDLIIEDSGESYIDLLPDLKTLNGKGTESQALSQEGIEIFLAEINKLPDKPRFVMEQKYIYGKTLTEIGKEMDLSRERARQIEGQALRELRRSRVLRETFQDCI